MQFIFTNNEGYTMKSIKSLILSLTLLASFAGVRAMDANDEEMLEKIVTSFNKPVITSDIVTEYLSTNGTIEPTILENMQSTMFQHKTDIDGNTIFAILTIKTNNGEVHNFDLSHNDIQSINNQQNQE